MPGVKLFAASTVTFSNPVFNLGARSGTVRVAYDAGADGGTIQNCAHLTGPGVNLEECDTREIAVDAPHVRADGEVITHAQRQWGIWAREESARRSRRTSLLIPVRSVWRRG